MLRAGHDRRRRYFLKRLSPASDWIMRATGDHVHRPYLIWQAGIMDKAPGLHRPHRGRHGGRGRRRRRRVERAHARHQPRTWCPRATRSYPRCSTTALSTTWLGSRPRSGAGRTRWADSPPWPSGSVSSTPPTWRGSFRCPNRRDPSWPPTPAGERYQIGHRPWPTSPGPYRTTRPFSPGR